MEKEGKLTGEGDKGLEGRPFLDGQLVKAGQMLGNIWLTAWLEAPEDQYLESTTEGTQRDTIGERKVKPRVNPAAGPLAVREGEARDPPPQKAFHFERSVIHSGVGIKPPKL